MSFCELVGAYRALAKGGVFSALQLTPGAAARSRRVFDAGAAYIVADMLADREARSLTESTAVQVKPARARAPRIAYPRDGEFLALDTDIPAAQQKNAVRGRARECAP